MKKKLKLADGTEVELDLADDQEIPDGFVDAKSHKQAVDDMMKYKKESKQRLAELEAERVAKQAAEQNALEEKGEYKKLYEKEAQEKLQLTQTIAQKEKALDDTIKRNAVAQKLGGFKNPTYASFINVDAVEIDENKQPVPESVDKEVNRIRQTHPELLKAAASFNIPGHMPAGGSDREIDYSKLSETEYNRLVREALAAQTK